MAGMYDFAEETVLDRAQVRARYQRMDDAALLRMGRAARYMCSPYANLGQPPRTNFVIQLEEAIAEWKSRHPDERRIHQTAPADPPVASTSDS